MRYDWTHFRENDIIPRGAQHLPGQGQATPPPPPHIYI